MNNKYALKLLALREHRDVLGNRYCNLWLLTAVITLTFLSVAFSNASMEYLTAKMDDPFTNWINYKFSGNISEDTNTEFQSEEFQARFQIKSVQADYSNTTLLFVNGKNMADKASGRFLNDLGCDLVEAILSKGNVVGDQKLPIAEIPEGSLGIFITAEALERFGYSSTNAPAFIDFAEYSPGADTLGVETTVDGHARVPIPILSVVRKLPDNVDFIASSFFYEQERAQEGAFDMSNPEYQTQLIYFVPVHMDDEFQSELQEHYSCLVNAYDDYIPNMKSCKTGHFYQVYPNGEDIDIYQSTACNIESTWQDEGVQRVYNYYLSDNASQTFKDYISFNFLRLDSIRPFEQYMRDKYRIKIDMTQINTKENFNAVSWLANILSWAMIVFAIICIILFIVNMMQSYFQKVKRNMGTFKAFGISVGSLLLVYVKMIFAIVGSAIIFALIISWALELLLQLLGVEREGGYSYLQLWNVETLVSIIIILIATILTVYLVMSKLLKRTPGDLIYDR